MTERRTLGCIERRQETEQTQDGQRGKTERQGHCKTAR